MSVSEAPAGNVVRLSARSRHLALSGSALLLLAGLGWYLSDAKGHSHEIIPRSRASFRRRYTFFMSASPIEGIRPRTNSL